MSRNASIFTVLVLASLSRSLGAATLTEWPLPAAAITAIDASQGWPIALGDTGSSCLTDLVGNMFTQYCSPVLPFTPGDDLRALVTPSDRYIWMSEHTHKRLARLHETASPPYYDLWTLPDAWPEPGLIDLNRANGSVVFAAFDAAQALIGYMVPSMPMAVVTTWDVSSVVLPGGAITGLAFYRSAATLYAIFTVYRPPGSSGVGILDMGNDRLQFWSVPFVLPARVAVDQRGRALFSHDGAPQAVDILDWASSQQKSWKDTVNSFIDEFVTVDPFGSPLFPAVTTMGSFDVLAVNTSMDPWTPLVPPPWTLLRPTSLMVFWDRVDATVGSFNVSPSAVPIGTIVAPPFTYYMPTNGIGPISADLTTPFSVDVWFLEAPNQLARISPP